MKYLLVVTSHNKIRHMKFRHETIQNVKETCFKVKISGWTYWKIYKWDKLTVEGKF